MRKRVLTGTILGLVLFGLGAAGMDRLLERQIARYESLLHVLVPLEDKVDEMHLLLLQQRSLIERSTFLEEVSIEELAEASADFDEALAAAFTVSFSILERSERPFSPTSEELGERLSLIQEAFARHSNRLRLLFDRLQASAGGARSLEPLISEVLAEVMSIQDAVANFEELLGTHYDAALASAAQTRASARQLFVVAVVVALVLGTLANAFFYRSLLPLKSMVDAVREITRGRYEVQVPIEGGEEVAFLAGEFNTMVRALSEQRMAIERGQEVIRATFDGIRDVLVVHDEHGNVLHANPAARLLAHGRGLDEPGCSRAMLGLDRDCPGLRQGEGPDAGPRLEIVQDAETGSSYELSFQRVSGAGGEVRFVVELVRDITQKLELERFLRQSEKLTAIGELSLGVAHEVRNPLSTIQMTLHSLGKRQDLSPPERERLDLAMNEVGRLEGLVSSLLDYGRPSAPAVAPVELRAVLQRSVELVKSESARSSVSVELGPLDPRLPRIEADADQIIQVMVNLLLNAIQASPPEGRVLVEVSSPAGRRQRETVVVRVIDRGNGIGPKQLKQIFTPFFTTRKDGTGLGLPVARKIVEAHGGEMTVQSAQARGTTVSLRLPVRRREMESPAP